ncbi:hypothetical protein D3C76_1651220 [compost metagenome]
MPSKATSASSPGTRRNRLFWRIQAAKYWPSSGMNTIDGRSGKALAIIPARNDTWVT